MVVNGGVVIDEAEHTGALPGRVLRREPMALDRQWAALWTDRPGD